MRDKLAERTGQRHFYIARLKLYGIRHLRMERRKRRGTALLTGVCSDKGELLTKHVWVEYAEPFVLAGIFRGQHVSFTAIATPYLRGHWDTQVYGHQELDYKLADVEDVLKLDPEQETDTGVSFAD